MPLVALRPARTSKRARIPSSSAVEAGGAGVGKDMLAGGPQAAVL